MTPKQAEILLFTHNYIQKNGYSPTYQEIADGLNLSSKSRVNDVMRILKDQGFIDYTFKSNRSVKILKIPQALINPAGWQPIETAPKDGSRILMFSPANPKAVNNNCRYEKMRVDYWRETEAYKGFWSMYPETPYTHWQPLPEPPKESK